MLKNNEIIVYPNAIIPVILVTIDIIPVTIDITKFSYNAFFKNSVIPNAIHKTITNGLVMISTPIMHIIKITNAHFFNTSFNIAK